MWSILLTATVERIGVMLLLFTKLKEPERFIISSDLSFELYWLNWDYIESKIEKDGRLSLVYYNQILSNY